MFKLAAITILPFETLQLKADGKAVNSNNTSNFVLLEKCKNSKFIQFYESSEIRSLYFVCFENSVYPRTEC